MAISIPFSCDAKAALDLARATLTGNNFRIEMHGTNELYARSEGITSSRQNPIVGVTKMTLRVTDTAIEAEVEYDGTACLI